MENELKMLYEAQKLDSMIFEMERKIVQSPKKMDDLDNEFHNIADKVSKEKEIIEELEKERRKKEKDLEMERDKIKKLESRLYEVKTNKEYQALLKEIETIKTEKDTIEEDIINLMEKIEEFKKDFDSTEALLKEREGEIDKEKKVLQKDLDSVEKSIDELKKSRDEYLSMVGKKLKQTYFQIRDKRGGVAVVNVKNGVCLGCYMNIPPQLFIEVTKNYQLILCPSCNRIFYYTEEEN